MTTKNSAEDNSGEVSIDEWINCIFEIVEPNKETEYYQRAVLAFENLLRAYIKITSASSKIADSLMENLITDHIGIVSMLKRFQRDAYGLVDFEQYLDSLESEGLIDATVKDPIALKVSMLGLRVASFNPRKTRVAAAFSLWMCVFRPMFFEAKIFDVVHLKPSGLASFCAAFNYWLSTSYLSKFGEVILSELPDADVRLERIRHDFTYREVNFSSMETMYCSIWRKKPETDLEEAV